MTVLRDIVGAVLRHPAVRPAKRAARTLWWRFHGRSIANPPVPERVESVLFVCLGNICRSPFAEVLAVSLAAAGPRPVRFSSAGIRTTQAAASPQEARRAAKLYGVSLDSHRPRPLTPEMMGSHDVIVVMESGQRDVLRAMYPDHRDRVFLLSLFEDGASGVDRYVIADPFGQPLDAYEACYQRIEAGVTSLLTALGIETAVGKAASRRSA